MNRPIIEVRFYETYYFANVVQNILKDQFEFLGSLHEFFCDDQYFYLTKPYQRYSAFHSFLAFVIDGLLRDATENVDIEERSSIAEKFKNIPGAIEDMQPTALPIELALRHHGYDFETFDDWLSSKNISFHEATSDDIYEFLNDLRLSSAYEEFLTHSIREVFFLLFRDRHVLLLFNDMVAGHISDSSLDDSPEDFLDYFSRSGVLKRAYMPDWVRRAVFYRDRGMCVSCRVDLSGLLNIWSEDHFDHIVPLERGGLNDVTNIQLLCATCNLRKSNGEGFTSISYEDWYPFEKD
ncbi:HNH endonuclease [Duganella sp. FT92W]|uniref:HNH endonuclease n=1 Tax=Pseudoduganella rivuli TaxID=2666085 RepID=A0A7X2LW88_9BURK|nr:HNH endonuclease [Pseudoduganella rivuli]MRV76306.1 HNH endonuclease [Pseudoduganella rivuli]